MGSPATLCRIGPNSKRTTTIRDETLTPALRRRNRYSMWSFPVQVFIRHISCFTANAVFLAPECVRDFILFSFNHHEVKRYVPLQRHLSYRHRLRVSALRQTL